MGITFRGVKMFGKARLNCQGLIAIVFLALIGIFQNCGDFEAIQLKVAAPPLAKQMSEMPAKSTPTPSPTPAGPPTLTSWNDPFPAPERAPNCLTDPKYNICLVGKDPVTTFGQSFNPLFTPNSATLTQETGTFVYGAVVPTTAFTNANFNISVPSGNLVAATTNGNWKHHYTGDAKAFVGQVNAWYWLNRQVSMMTSRTGKFWNTGKNTKIVVRDTSQNVLNNAYFDFMTNTLVIGRTNFGNNNNTTNLGDLALDIGIIAHEGGHSNLEVAVNGTTGSTAKEACGNNGCYCKSAKGCFSAIHEGMADFHALILFPDAGGTIGAYYSNNFQGLRNIDTVRAMSKTASSLYTNANPDGEVHDMGQVYNSIWYGVWKKHKSAGTEKDIEVLFTAHLASLNGSDDFVTAYSGIDALIANLFPAKATQLRQDFRAEYMALGLTLP